VEGRWVGWLFPSNAVSVWNVLAFDERINGELERICKMWPLESLNKIKINLSLAGILADI
jgi:hypothetical protein